MHYSSLESSHQDESNGGCFSFLRSLDAEIFHKTSKIGIFYIYNTAPFDVLLNISASNDRRKMHYSSLESPRQDESNGGCFSFLRSLDAEISSKTSNGAV